MQPPDRLRTEALDPVDLDQAGRDPVLQLGSGRNLPVLDQGDDLLLERLADPVELGHPTLPGQLLDRDFDAILLTKVIGSETRATLRKKIREVGESYDRFSEDYLLHQGIYFDRSYYELATDFYTETSLYCICEGKERDLIWRAGILISNPKNIDKVVSDYVGMLLKEMENLQLILGTEVF